MGRALMGIGALLLAFAVACGGDSDGDKPAKPTGPIGPEEFGMTEEQLVTAINAVEAEIAACMEDAGFEYLPIDVVTFREQMDALNRPRGLSNEEFISQYGYGFSTMPPSSDFGVGPANEAIRAALSQADQVAYAQTLLGDDLEATFVRTLEDEDFSSTDGCTEEAVNAVFDEEQLDPNFENPFDVLVAADSRVVAAVKEWSSCMSEAGFDFDSPEDAEDEILDRLETLTDGEDPSTLSGSDRAVLEQIQADERAIAALDDACQAEHLRDVEEQVEREISGQG